MHSGLTVLRISTTTVEKARIVVQLELLSLFPGSMFLFVKAKRAYSAGKSNLLFFQLPLLATVPASQAVLTSILLLQSQGTAAEPTSAVGTTSWDMYAEAVKTKGGLAKLPVQWDPIDNPKVTVT